VLRATLHAEPFQLRFRRGSQFTFRWCSSLPLYRIVNHETHFRPNHFIRNSKTGEVWGIEYKEPYYQLQLKLHGDWVYHYSHGGQCLDCGLSRSAARRRNRDHESWNDEEDVCPECGGDLNLVGDCDACRALKRYTILQKARKCWASAKIGNWLYSKYLQRFRNRSRDMILMIVYKKMNESKPVEEVFNSTNSFRVALPGRVPFRVLCQPKENVVYPLVRAAIPEGPYKVKLNPAVAKSKVKKVPFYKREGTCWRFCFSYRKRARAAALIGDRVVTPAVIIEVCRQLQQDMRRKVDLYYHTEKHANVVKRDGKGDFTRQLFYVAKHNPDSVIGGEVPFEECCYYCGLKTCFCDAEYYPKLSDSDDEDAAEPETYEEEIDFTQACFGGDSDCWTKIIDGDFHGSDRDRMRFRARAYALYEQKEGLDIDLFTKEDPIDFSQLSTLFEVSERAFSVRTSINRIAKQPMWLLLSQFEENLWHIEEVVWAPERPSDDHWSKEEVLQGVNVITRFGSSNSSALSPLDQSINALRLPENQQQAEGFVFDYIGDTARRAKNICPWHIPMHNRDIATKHFDWTSRATDHHDHPIHAALRRMSHLEASKYWFGDVDICFMSPETFSYLASNIDSVDMTLRNSVLDIKDIGRYCKYPEGLNHNVFDFPATTGHVAHFDECGHYFSNASFLNVWKKNPNLTIATVTHIVPIEALFQEKPSRPGFAQWTKVNKSELVYCPEGDKKSHYPQPVYPELLLTRTIRDEDSDLIIYGSAVWTAENTYLQVWVKVHVEVPKYFLRDYEMVMPMPRLYRSQPRTGPIPVFWWVEIRKYLKSVPNVKIEDVHAKLRQISGKQELSVDEFTTEVFAKVVLHSIKFDLPDLQSKHYQGFGSMLAYKSVGHIRRLFNKHFVTKYTERWGHLISTPNTIGVIPLVNARVRLDKSLDVITVDWEIFPEERQTFLDYIRRIYRFVRNVASDDDVDMTGVGYDSRGYFNSRAAFVSNLSSERKRKNLTPEDVRRIQSEYLLREVLNHRRDLEDEAIAKAEKMSDEEETRKAKVLGDILNKLENRKDKEFKKKEEEEDMFKSQMLALDPAPSYKTAPSKTSASSSDSSSDASSVYSDVPSILPPAPIQGPANIPMPANPTIKADSVGEIPTGYLIDHPANLTSAFPVPVIVAEESVKLKRKLSVEQKLDKENLQIVEVHHTGTDSGPVNDNRKLWESVKKSALKGPNNAKLGKYIGADYWDTLFPLTMGRRYKAVPFKDVMITQNYEYPDEDCLLGAVSKLTNERHVEILLAMTTVVPKSEMATYKSGLSINNLWVYALKRGLCFEVHHQDGKKELVGVVDQIKLPISLKDNHWKALVPKNSGLLFKLDKSPLNTPPLLKSLLRELNALPTIDFVPWTPAKPMALLLLKEMINGTVSLLGKSGAGKLALKALRDRIMAAEAKPRHIAVVQGHPGCRKSSGLQKVLKKPQYHQFNMFKVILPTNVLREDWAIKLDVKSPKGPLKRPTPSNYVMTFDTAMADQKSANIMVLDEYKFSKGYMDLLAWCFPDATHFIYLGDEDQCEKHEVSNDCDLNDPRYPSEGTYFSRYCTQYLVGTWRFDGILANILQMPSFVKHGSKLFFSDSLLTNKRHLEPFFPHYNDDEIESLWKNSITCVPGEADIIANRSTNSNDAVTYVGSQGLTEVVTFLVVTHVTAKACDIKSIYTAFTRSTHVIIVVQRWGAEEKRACLSNPLLRELMLYYYPNTPKHTPAVFDPDHTVDIMTHLGSNTAKMKWTLSGPPEKLTNLDYVKKWWPPEILERYIDHDKSYVKGGHSMLSREDPAYVDDANFKKFIDLPPEIKQNLEVSPKERPIEDVSLKTHLIKTTLADLDERQESKIVDRSERELSWKGLMSEQFPDWYLTRADVAEIRKKEVDALMRLGMSRREANRQFNDYLRRVPPGDNPTKFKPDKLNWGQLQSTNDHASFAAGVKQRIRRATYAENVDDWKNGQYYGHELFNNLKRHMQWGESEAFDPLLYAQCQQEFSERRAARSQALKKSSLKRADPDYVDTLHAKNQWKMKDIDPPVAKPLQTILIKSDEYLFKLGGVGVYLLKKIQQLCPSNIYLHANKTFKDMSDWIYNWDLRSGEYMNIDIHGFDGSQRGASLQMELEVLEFFQIPEDLIEFYKHDKLDAHTNSMFIGLMRLSGELFTWLFNTIFEIARTVTKYNIPVGDPIAGSGDDIELFRRYVERIEWIEKWEEHDICDEVTSITAWGEFCSWYINNGVVVKDPIILFKRLRGAMSRGKIKDVIDGYFIEFMTLYNQSDNLYNIISEDRLEYVSWLNVFFHNLRRFVGVNKVMNFEKYIVSQPNVNEKAIAIFLDVYSQEEQNHLLVSGDNARVFDYEDY
jgi:hypothetical protein